MINILKQKNHYSHPIAIKIEPVTFAGNRLMETKREIIKGIVLELTSINHYNKVF